jgi:hypothetical protein
MIIYPGGSFRVTRKYTLPYSPGHNEMHTQGWLLTKLCKVNENVLADLERSKSAKCNSIQNQDANLPDPPIALTSDSTSFQMLPAPPGALQGAFRLCRSILWCF